MPVPRPMSERFWEKVDVHDCWTWTGRLDVCGYGAFKFSGSWLRAHRVAYE